MRGMGGEAGSRKLHGLWLEGLKILTQKRGSGQGTEWERRRESSEC